MKSQSESRYVFMRIAILSCLVIVPGSAYALQVHSAPEGLSVHQFAHVFFILSMAILAFWLQKSGLIEKKGWRYIQVGCLFFILWNIDAMAGHFIEFGMGEDVFSGNGWTKALVVDSKITHLLYYFLKMDHLLCVPAIVFLYLGLRRLAMESGGHEHG